MDALARAIERPEPVAGLADRSPLAGLARRSVGFADVLAQSVSAVAPAGAAFTTPLLVSAVAGGVSLPALAAALVIALLTASTINEFTRRMAATGSLYTFVARGLGSARRVRRGRRPAHRLRVHRDVRPRGIRVLPRAARDAAAAGRASTHCCSPRARSWCSVRSACSCWPAASACRPG